MKEIMLSVLLPNFNNERYLKDCLDSLLNQSFQDFVIYFIDDFSSDRSVEIAKTYPKDKIEIIVKESNTGIVDTLNIGLAKVKTKYFIRMDGDDISNSNRFKILVDFMEANQNIGVCSSAIETFGVKKELRRYQSNPEINKANLIFGHSIGHASSIFRTEIFTKSKIIYLDRFWRLEDYDLFYRLKDVTMTTAINDLLYYYRQEDYNFNPEIEVKKNQEYKRFYKMILLDLNPDTSEPDVQLHLELSGRVNPTQRLKCYKQHINKLIHFNKQKKCYPASELKSVLKQKLNRLQFALLDRDFFRLRDLNIFAWKQNIKVIRYYLGKRKLR